MKDSRKKRPKCPRATPKQTWVEWMWIQTWTRMEKELEDLAGKELPNRNLVELREILLGILTDRFGSLPASLVVSVESCKNLASLQVAIRKSATAASLEEYQL